MKKKQLTAAIMTALMTMSASAYAAEKTETMDSYELAPVDVAGQRTTETGTMTAETASLGALGAGTCSKRP